MTSPLARSLGATLLALILAGCAQEPPRPAATTSSTFSQEFAMTVAAGRGTLSEDQRRELAAWNHPLLMQIAEPSTLTLVRLFADLPDELHADLQARGSLKWDFASLDASRQRVLRDLIQLNVEMATRQGTPANPAFGVEALAGAQTGFAVVDITGTDQRVVSWFVLWPEMPDPTWVTIVNARACGTPAYFQAHLQQLTPLRDAPVTAPPAI